MTFQEFDDFQAKLLAEVVKMKDTKGKEYANSESRFANFDRLAVQLNLTNIQVAWVYTTKHLDGIAQFCRTGVTHSTEPIRGRIVDAITYLTLIAGMIKESSTAGINETGYKNFECPFCDKVTSNLDSHNLHVKLCRFKPDAANLQQQAGPNQTPQLYECRACTFISSGPKDLIDHYSENPLHLNSKR